MDKHQNMIPIYPISCLLKKDYKSWDEFRGLGSRVCVVGILTRLKLQALNPESLVSEPAIPSAKAAKAFKSQFLPIAALRQSWFTVGLGLRNLGSVLAVMALGLKD